MNGSRRFSAAELLLSSEPLSDEACLALIDYCEEDDCVDFKEEFDTSGNSKSWIDLAIDCSALANTFGGYLVFGIRDKTWERKGLPSEVAAALSDIKRVLEKVNRNLVPPITRARARSYKCEGREYVIVAVPVSAAVTHVFEADMAWKTPAGTAISGVRQGAIYTRRSGSNAILTSSDFEQLVNRRLQHFRDKWMEGITRVIHAPAEAQVVTIAKVVGARGEAGLQVIDAPPSSELAGQSLSFTVNTLADKINLFKTLVKPSDSHLIDERLLFEAFAVRHDVDFSSDHQQWLAVYSMLRQAPVFYWLKDLGFSAARSLIQSAFDAGKGVQRAFIVNYAAFYGEAFHRKLHERLPPSSARPFSGRAHVFQTRASRHIGEDELRATELARLLSTDKDQRAIYELERLDCSLYAPFD